MRHPRLGPKDREGNQLARSTGRRHRRAGIAAGLGLAVVAAFAAAADLPAVHEEWRHFRSPNFELYSTTPEKDSRTLLHNLELLRAVFFERFKVTERTRLEVTVFSFASREHFLAYAPPGTSPRSQLGAFYLPHPDRAIIVIGPTPAAPAPVMHGAITFASYVTSAQRLIFHEYIHHLFRATDQQPTLWLNEGFAEMLATIEVHRDHIEIGHANAPTLLLLRNTPLLPFESIFGATSTSPVYREHTQQAMFYAQSWALLHYLHFGESKLPRAGIDRFVRVMGDRKLAAGVKASEFFTECFGFDYAEMQRRLDKYIGNGKYRYGTQPLPALPADTTYAMRAAPADERALRLAELAVRMQRSAAGKLALLNAQESGKAEPRVYEVLGTLAIAEENLPRAREHWEKAIELGTTNGAVPRELGLLESREWFQRFDFDFRLPPDVAIRLRERLLNSIRQEPAQSAGYEMLAFVEAFSPEPVIENVNLVQQHFRQLSERPRTLVALAMVRVRLGKAEEAQTLLAELDQLPSDPFATKIAEIIRARLAAAPKRAAAQ